MIVHRDEHFSLSRAAHLILVVLLVLVAPGFAGGANAQPPQPGDLLRRAIANEKSAEAEKDGYYAWSDRLQKIHGSVTKIMVSTPHGILSRTILINDRALTAAERSQDDDRINRLLDPAKMKEKAAHQREDQQHIDRMLAALPDAFRCQYSTAAPEDHNLHLDCSPRPGFSPPNYESQVLQGMKATILIDRQENRIARIEGTLFRDVNFGWGVLGHLDHGGRIEIAQSKVSGEHWGIQRMSMVFDGRLVIFKPLHIEETETSWDYRAVPRMSVAQALDYLRNYTPRPNR
jgi:hypothetical protein